jgi:hypothetical protein
MKGLKEELDELREIFRNITPETEEEYQNRFLSIQERYTSPEDVEAINDFMMSLYKVMDEKIEEVDRLLTIQEQLKPYKEILPISYIARTYFGKSAAWLQQRLYGYKVRGKVYSLSDKDINTLNLAIQDISKKIGSLSITA